MNEGAGARRRLILVTPPAIDPARFPALLEEALAAGDVAAVLVASGRSEEEREAAARLVVPVAQQRGAAAIVLDQTRVAGRVRADGVQIATGPGDLRAAVESVKPKGIVGAGECFTRHAAMEAGEMGVDYLFFGRPHGDTHAGPHPRALALAEWWTDLTEIPAVAMAGHALETLDEAAATGAEFIALHRAVWEHPAGPADAVRQAAGRLAGEREAA